MRYVRNQDPADVARTASVQASSELPDSPARLVLDGYDRDYPVNKTTGAKAETHHWGAAMKPDGEWIELSWPAPQSLREVVLQFDSGFPRELTLTASDSHTRGILREPQPELVRDYDVLAKLPDGQLRKLAEVRANHQRLNRVRFDEVRTAAVRIHVRKTNGSPEARIFQIRCYA
jgi:hypothetical protein